MKNLLYFTLILFSISIFSNEIKTPMKIESFEKFNSNQSSDSSLLWHIDHPLPNETVSGIAIVQGWVLSKNSISGIHLYIDGEYKTSANIDLPRDDVIEHYPQYANTPSARPGFTVGFYTREYSNGKHSLYLVVNESNGNSTVIGNRYFYIDNTINPGPRGYVESPMPLDTVWGPYPISGWVLDENGVERVEILVDGLVVGRANLGGPRPDIYYAFSLYPNAARSGFVMFLDTTRIENGYHKISVLAYDYTGQSSIIGERQVLFSNQPVNLPPFGKIDWPLRDIEMIGQCDTSCGGPSGDPSCYRPLNFVLGWALDTGAGKDQGGVAWVELLLDGQMLFNSKTDCYYDTDLKTWVDCYGIPRFDVQNYFPGYTNVPEAGFKFWLDVGNLILSGISEGIHYISIRAGDLEDTHTIIDQIPVLFKCIYRTTGAWTRPAGYIDYPGPYEYVKEYIWIRGWAIDYNRIDKIRVWIDGVYWGDAVYGDPRPDVYENYERSNLGYYSGWHFGLDTTLLSNSEHDLVIEVVDINGDTRILGERRFIVFNNITIP